ncbi:MAG: leucine-rich repeat protein, partial [Lachnospiraceae bacterium]|nr:leucine-rich repeat protein [Lachnospiraceae bacterium]
MSDEIKVESKNKLNKTLLLIVALILGIVLIALLVIFVPKAAKAKSVEKQLSLGEKYLDELDYEQAIASYLAVIEIDPKNEDAYLALADIYMEMGEYEKAEEILEQAEEEILSKDIWEKQQDVEKAIGEAENTPIPTATCTPIPIATNTPVPTVTNTPMPTVTNTPVPTVTNTPVPTATNTPVPTATNTPVPTATSTPVPTATNTPVPTATNTPVPTATSTPTPAPTATPTPVTEGNVRVELELASDCFTYATHYDKYLCTGLSEKGYAEFQKYDSAYLVSIRLPGTSDTGREVYGFHSNSDGGYDLTEMLTEKSAYVELVCADNYTVYYGIRDNSPKSKCIHKLKNVALNKGLELIGNNAFYRCLGIEKINIPETVKEIGSYAFDDCATLIDITFSTTLEKIGSYSFRKTGLTKVVIPDSVKEIGGGAFYQCADLKEAEIPENVKTFGWGVFYECSNLVIDSFEIGGKTFGSSVFKNVRINKLVMSREVAKADSDGSFA